MMNLYFNKLILFMFLSFHAYDAHASALQSSDNINWQRKGDKCYYPLNNPNLETKIRWLAQSVLKRSDSSVGCVTFPYLGTPYYDDVIRNKAHAGIDFRTNNDPVYAVEAGHVRKVSFNLAKGRSTLIIENLSRSRKTLYLHMSRIDVKEGDIVDRGTQVGISGSVGACNGSCPHLHLETWGLHSPLYCTRNKSISGSACPDSLNKCEPATISFLTINPTSQVDDPDWTNKSHPHISPPSTNYDTWMISPNAFGKIRIGMNTQEIENNSNDKIISHGSWTCSYIKTRNGPCGVSYMMQNGKLARIDIDTHSIKTDMGISVGSTIQEVTSAYGALKPEKLPRNEPGNMFVIKDTLQNQNTQLRLYTDGNKVLHIRAGLSQAVNLIERCN